MRSYKYYVFISSLLVILIPICTSTSGTNEKRELWNVYKRMIDMENDRVLRRPDCKKEGQPCKGHCCKGMACYRPEGFSMFTRGTCVKCIREDLKCQRDLQCCPNFQCDRGNALWVDGTCQKYRRTGSCYRDGQCVTACVKGWYQTHGECS